jgi:hypothetical protein
MSLLVILPLCFVVAPEEAEYNSRDGAKQGLAGAGGSSGKGLARGAARGGGNGSSNFRSKKTQQEQGDDDGGSVASGM